MKNLSILLIIFSSAFSFTSSAQNIHGIWTGTLKNDSTGRIQEFEMGLSEYRGKITGYTYTTFIENDTFYYSIKRIKAHREDGQLVIEDGEMVGNNFPEKRSKGVKQTTYFPLVNDSTIDIANGRWETNKTKRYYSIGGSATISVQQNEQSDLVSHLQELNVQSDIVPTRKAVVTSESTSGTVANQNDSRYEKEKPAVEKKDLAKNSNKQAEEKTNKKQEPVNDKKINADVIVDNKNQQHHDSTNSSQQTIGTKDVASSTKKIDDAATKTGTTNLETTKPGTKKETASSTPRENKDISVKKPDAVVERKTEVVEKTAEVTPTSHNVPTNTANELPMVVAKRKNEPMQDILFKNDSLVLSLYDNGIVDGDTVSVFMNGENIILKQKLKEAAIKKTIYIPANADSVQLVLFAENLGTIPPNTGLLTIRDGGDVYQVRFSADLEKNTSIILRRRRQ